MQPTALKVVIVDDNVSLADIYKTRLQLLGYEVYTAYDGKEALYVIEHQKPALVLLDLMVPKIAGDQILETMRTSDWGKNIKVLIISNLNEADAPTGLRAQGIEGYAVKANLSDDALDKLVDDILKPTDQQEDVSLEIQETAKNPEPAPPQVSPAPAQDEQSTTAPPAPQASSIDLATLPGTEAPQPPSESPPPPSPPAPVARL